MCDKSPTAPCFQHLLLRRSGKELPLRHFLQHHGDTSNTKKDLAASAVAKCTRLTRPLCARFPQERTSEPTCYGCTCEVLLYVIYVILVCWSQMAGVFPAVTISQFSGGTLLLHAAPKPRRTARIHTRGDRSSSFHLFFFLLFLFLLFAHAQVPKSEACPRCFRELVYRCFNSSFFVVLRRLLRFSLFSQSLDFCSFASDHERDTGNGHIPAAGSGVENNWNIEFILRSIQSTIRESGSGYKRGGRLWGVNPLRRRPYNSVSRIAVKPLVSAYILKR